MGMGQDLVLATFFLSASIFLILLFLDFCLTEEKWSPYFTENSDPLSTQGSPLLVKEQTQTNFRCKGYLVS